MNCLQSLLYWIYNSEINLKKEHDKLYDSVTDIKAYRMHADTPLDEVMQNMQVGARGSIRTANSIIDMVYMVRGLSASANVDVNKFIKEWNKISGKTHALTSKRAMSLRLLFHEAPRAVLDSILRHVQDIRMSNFGPFLVSPFQLLGACCKHHGQQDWTHGWKSIVWDDGVESSREPV